MDGQQETKGQQLAGLLAELDRTFRDGFKRSNKVPFDVTLAQYEVMTFIAKNGQCSQKAIAKQLGVTGPTVVRIIDALEKKALVVRSRHNNDRRIVHVSLTDKGRAIQHECALRHEERLSTMIERLPAASADVLLGSLAALLNVGQ